jgi:hypothetical protein
MTTPPPIALVATTTTTDRSPATMRSVRSRDTSWYFWQSLHRWRLAGPGDGPFPVVFCRPQFSHVHVDGRVIDDSSMVGDTDGILYPL